MNQFEKAITRTKPTRIEYVNDHNKSVKVNYLPREFMDRYFLFGYAINGEAYINDKLSGRVEKFVIKHELYHLRDNKTWLGWVGQETRANVACGIKDPIGLFATIRSSLTRKRIKSYINAFNRVGFKRS